MFIIEFKVIFHPIMHGRNFFLDFNKSSHSRLALKNGITSELEIIYK